jgi:hypothetical protein
VTTLVYQGELSLVEAPHLVNAEHLFLLIDKGVVVGKELNLEGVGELLDHFKVEEVEELREEAVLGLIDVDLIDGPRAFLAL